jgi:hypothetical protein
MLLKEMIFDGRYPNLRVDPQWFEDRHPLEFLAKVEDPIALYRPSPEVIRAPTAPVLTVTLVLGTAHLTWSPSETDITEIRSYSIYRGIDGATPTLLLVCEVERDFLGGITGVESCTTTPSIALDDTGRVIDKVTVEDAPISYVDSAVTVGHTYCYYVTAQVLGNNQSVAQGPPSAASNTACVTIAAAAVQLYSAWSPWTTITPSGPYAPGLAAVQAGNPKPFVVVVAQLLSGDDPMFTYGGTNPVAKMGGSNGACWMYVFDLSAHPPATNVLNATNGNSNYTAATFYNVSSYQTHMSAMFPGLPFLDTYNPVPTGSCLVPACKAVHSSIPTISSSDPAALTQTTSADIFNNGTIIASFQFPTQVSVTSTCNSGPGPLDNIPSCLLSP